MKSILIVSIFLALACAVSAQSKVYIRGDSVYIQRDGGNGELILRNATRDTSNGVLINYGNGVTRFVRVRAINDSAIVIGSDTVVIKGGVKGGTAIDTTSLSDRIDARVKYSDTTLMLVKYLRRADTATLSNRIDLRVKYGDTASMLSAYLLKGDTSSMSGRIEERMKYDDTASLSDRINAKQPVGNYITGLNGDGAATGPGLANFVLSTTSVIPGSYTNANITVDGKGRITSASNGSGGGSGDVDSIHIYTASAPDPDTMYQYIAGDSTLVGYIPKGAGDNWGSQVVQHDATLTGNGTSGTPLKADTAIIATKAYRQKGDDSVAAALRQVIIDTAADIRADFPGVPNLQQVTTAGNTTTDSMKVRTVALDSALYLAVRNAADTLAMAQRRGLLMYDSASRSLIFRGEDFWTFISDLNNSLIPNRPNMRLIAGVIRPTVTGSTVTWNWIINSSHDSIGFSNITCDGSSINLALQNTASKIHTILAVPDETLAQYIDVGISFLTTSAHVYIKRRIGVISGYFQGNGTTYVWTGSPGVTSSYNTSNGQLNFDYNSDYTPASNGTSVRYVGTGGFTCKRLFSGLSGNDRGYQVTDMFGNGVVGAPTSSDVIEVVVGDQLKPATINPCSAPGDGWAAYVFGGGTGNIWVIGLIEL